MVQQYAARRETRAQLHEMFPGPAMQLKQILWEGPQMIVELRAEKANRRAIENATIAAYDAVFRHDASVPEARVRVYDAATDTPLFGTILSREDWTVSGANWWVSVPFPD
jgi:hypothetical protein